MEIDKNEIWINRILVSVLCVGIIFSLVNFFNFRSLWLDEALLSVSIVDRNFAELLVPLEFDQVAPIGFLFIENMFANLFGNVDWSLRIFPFISFLISVALIFKFNKQLFKNVTIALLAATLFCLNSFVLYYSIEVKQYMSDTLICLLIMVTAVDYMQTKTRRSLINYSLVSILSVWFSNVAVIILFTAGLVVFYQVAIKDKLKSLKPFIPVSLGIISFACYYSLFIHSHPAKEPMVAYWTKNAGFLYTDIFSWEFRYFLRTRIQSILMVLLEIGNFWWFTLVFMCLGILTNFKNKTVLILLCLPICVHLALSYLRLYPFDRRLILYHVPLLISLLSVGLYKSYAFINHKFNAVPIYIVLIPVVINLVAVFNLIPLEKEELKKSMHFVNENLADTDQIYVYAVSKTPFNFYKHKFQRINQCEAIVYGELHRDNWKLHETQLSQLNNAVWLVFSHINTKDTDNFTEEDFIVESLVKNAYKVEDKKEYEGSTIYKLKK